MWLPVTLRRGMPFNQGLCLPLYPLLSVNQAIDLNSWRVDLQLSGHTHGGQIVIPGVGSVPTWIQASRDRIPEPLWKWTPFLDAKWPKVVNQWQWAQGLHSVGSNWLYINRGLGTFPPGRWNCSPEVTVFSFVA